MKRSISKTNPGLIYLQVAVQRTAAEVGGYEASHHRKRGLAVAVIYSTALADYRVYTECQAKDLLDILRAARLVVGYNCVNFDYEVLRGYRPFRKPPTLDLYLELRTSTGFGVPLGNLARNTLRCRVVCDGNAGTALWRSGQLDKLIAGCKREVDLIRMLHKHGVRQKKVRFKDAKGKLQNAPVNWRPE